MRIEHNIDEVVKSIGKAQRAINTETRRIIRTAQRQIATEAKAIVPVDTGDLKDSIKPTKIKAGRGRAFGLISGGVEAGGETAPYALVVHEDLSLTHETGQAKFLDTPGFAEEPVIEREIREVLPKAMKRAGVGK